MPEILNQASMFLLFPLCPSIGKDRACPLPLYRFLIETLRNPSPPSFPKFFIGNPKAFKNHGPRLKDCRGDERRVIETLRNERQRDDGGIQE